MLRGLHCCRERRGEGSRELTLRAQPFPTPFFLRGVCRIRPSRQLARRLSPKPSGAGLHGVLRTRRVGPGRAAGPGQVFCCGQAERQPRGQSGALVALRRGVPSCMQLGRGRYSAVAGAERQPCGRSGACGATTTACQSCRARTRPIRPGPELGVCRRQGWSHSWRGPTRPCSSQGL